MGGDPVPQFPREDLRHTMRRRSTGPTDLRNSVLNRDKDMRGMMRTKRRTSSDPPSPRTANKRPLTTSMAIDYLEQTIDKGEKFLDTGNDKSRQIISRLKRRQQFQKKRKALMEDHSSSSSSSSSDSNEEGEVEPSEDELTGVRFSESDTTSRTPKPGPPVIEPRSNPKSVPTENFKGDPKPGPSGN